MLKSLYSGVSGLQAHQTALDVVSNNIANVNTNGFKYSRANFSEMLSQTNKIATAPTGGLGGTNPMQIGLGSSADSTTRIYSQGSLLSTDKPTDVAITGKGFFIVSNNGGRVKRYTRDGNFNFDAVGNFVDANGNIVLGWNIKNVGDRVDTLRDIRPIKIKPGMVAPAGPTSRMGIKANLNAGRFVDERGPINSTKDLLDPKVQPDTMNVVLNAKGQQINLQGATKTAGGQYEGGEGVKISTGGPSSPFAEFRFVQNPQDIDLTDSSGSGVFYFNSTLDLASAVEYWASKDVKNTARSSGAKVSITDDGKFQITNVENLKAKNTANASKPMLITVNPIKDLSTTQNVLFTDFMKSFEGLIMVNNKKFTQNLTVPTHSTTMDIIDSLGSSHQIRVDFRKKDITPKGSPIWEYDISADKPAKLDGIGNKLTGNILTFDDNGAIASNTRTRFSFTGNNGSAPDQEIKLNFGTIGGYDGIKSIDAKTATTDITQDGYVSGDLQGISIDRFGKFRGTFSNGRSFTLGQIATARFNNNGGLMSEGSNDYSATANSGEAIVGTAGTAGRGLINSSMLESSNVDLSRSLTQLMVIQRGYQANSKTISTSDQVLNTLINLKN